MKLLIEKSNNKVSNIIKLEMLSTEFNSVTKLIKENEIPVVVFTDTSESYLINNINELINQSIVNTETILNIVTEDLILLGGSSESVDSRPYKVYTALLSQTGTGAPIATILENTLESDITYFRDSTGTYYAEASEYVFLDQSKITIVIGSNNGQFSYSSSITKAPLVITSQPDGNYFDIITANIVNNNLSDDILFNTVIEIKVYPTEDELILPPPPNPFE
jgi:hypothetical protein